MAKKPLVLDVDGTLLSTDMLFESFWAGLGQAPLATLRACFTHFTRPAKLKRALEEIVTLRTDLFPVNPAVREAAQAAQDAGREVVLASASDRALVERIAAENGFSERVFASEPGRNLKGRAKAAALVEAFGEGGFDYAGNAAVDRAVWEKADRALIVGDPASERWAEARGQAYDALPGGSDLRGIIKALRPHQWVKNVLLFVPLLAGHVFAPLPWLWTLLGMAAFSLAASSIYVVNDLLDLEADRLHEKKRFRPFASGRVSIPIGMAVGFGAGAVALGLAAALSWGFFAVIAGYMALSLAYSLKLKRMRWIDITVLASLYTIRVLAGALASGVGISVYLLTFIFPVFIALGSVKRLTEVSLAKTDARLPGRGYGKPDRGDLLNVALIGMVGALVSFFAYSFTEQAMVLYPTRWLVWLTLVPIAWWLGRMIRLGYYGKQDYDPIVFALTDKRGIGILLIALAMMFQAAKLWQGWFGM
ncbi:MAG: prenyltransferase [Rhodobacterales bacterium]|nr:MAG: prenyltransferase [Rhodobacterales bacterium]